MLRDTDLISKVEASDELPSSLFVTLIQFYSGILQAFKQPNVQKI